MSKLGIARLKKTRARLHGLCNPIVPGILLFSCVVAGGCGTPAGPPDPPDPCDAALALRTSPGFSTVAQEADIVARVIPGGFGGLYQDFAQQQIVVYLKDLSKATEARVALRDVLLCDGAYPGWANQLVTPGQMIFRSGSYTGTELYGYLQALQAVRSDPGVWGIEVDPEANRIWIGLRNQNDLSRIQQSVAAVSVPSAAVTLEVPPLPDGTEQFEVLDAPVVTQAHLTIGALQFAMHVRFSNLQPSPRYPERCAEGFDPHSFFRFVLDRWDGTQWKRAYVPVCSLTAFLPPTVMPGNTQTDSVPGAASRRLNSIPLWQTVRITGTYRLQGFVYTSVTPNPPFLGTLAPEGEHFSVPFRILHPLPF